MRQYVFIFILLVLILSCEKSQEKRLYLKELSCEYTFNPLGVENEHPSLSWILYSRERNQKQTAYQILVASSPEKLNMNIADLWNSNKVISDQSVHVSYLGKNLISGIRYYWKVRVWDKDNKKSLWSEPASWEMGLLHAEDWKAKWIGYESGEAAPLFRKEIEIIKDIEKATVYISGLGYYELSINGSKVGDHVLDPGQTDYEQRTFYVVYDITRDLLKGLNAVGVMLGNGWYNQYVVNHGRFGWKDVVYGKPKLLAQLHIIYTDGTDELIISDNTWKCSTGPITFNNIYLGEFYDARFEKPGWNKPGYNDDNWSNAKIVDGPGGRMESQKLQAIKKIKTIKPVRFTNPRPGVYVYDMGQNFAGWVKLRMKAGKGSTVQLRFAEAVFEDGMIDPASTGVYATDVVQTDRYTFKGDGMEEWEPRFTYHGFQYVEMTGFNGIPALDNIEGVVVHTAVEQTGTFECSDTMMNKIHRTAVWTTLDNFHSIITDCPHRERCGWLGDILAEMSSYNFNVPLLLIKFVEDIETGRKGGPPNHIAPGRRTGGIASSDWGSTFIQLPYYLYLYYGDISIARGHYEGMTFFMNYLQKIAKDYIIYEGWGDLFEPGSVRSKRTPSELTSTAFFYYDALLMKEMAKALENQEDAVKYSRLMANIKSNFIKKFYNSEIKTFGSQTGDAISLQFGLVPEEDEPAVAKSLRNDVVEKYHSHHSTGHMGTRYIYGELSRFGFGDVSQQMLNQTTYPSFGDLFQRGATTIWEYWGEREIDETSNGTRSRNHPFQGGFDVWFYNGIAGINPNPERTGFKHIILKPQRFGSINYAKASLNSIYGMIKSEWEYNDNNFSWKISIPVNTSSEVFIPCKSIENISESGKRIDHSEGIQFLRQEDQYFVFSLGSGDYNFIAKSTI